MKQKHLHQATKKSWGLHRRLLSTNPRTSNGLWLWRSMLALPNNDWELKSFSPTLLGLPWAFESRAWRNIWFEVLVGSRYYPGRRFSSGFSGGLLPSAKINSLNLNSDTTWKQSTRVALLFTAVLSLALVTAFLSKWRAEDRMHITVLIQDIIRDETWLPYVLCL